MPILNVPIRFKHSVKASIDERFQERSKARAKTSILKPAGNKPLSIVATDTLYVYAVHKDRRREKLGEAECKKVERVIVRRDSVQMNGEPVTGEELKKLVRMEGFESQDDFFAYYTQSGKQVFKGFRIVWGSTYKRKYFLHREIKKAGFELKLEETHKTICVAPELVEKAKANAFVKELQDKHNYGIQIINPLSR